MYSEFLLFRQYEFTSGICIICSAGDCLEMLDNAQKSFEEEHKISQVVMILGYIKVCNFYYQVAYSISYVHSVSCTSFQKFPLQETPSKL